MALEANY